MTSLLVRAPTGYADVIRHTPDLIGYWRLRETSGTVARDELNLVNGAYGATPILGLGSPIPDGAGAKFNGSSQYVTIAKDLSAYAAISISFWLYWDAFANNDKLASVYGTAYQPSGLYIDPNAGSGSFEIAFGGTGISWVDRFARPTALVWHHYLFTLDRTNKVNTAFVDGVPQTFTANVHNAGTYGNFGNNTMVLMAQGTHASLFGAGRLSEYAIFARLLTRGEAAMQYAIGSGR